MLRGKLLGLLRIRSLFEVGPGLQIDGMVEVGMRHHTHQGVNYRGEAAVGQPVLFSNHFAAYLSVLLNVGMVYGGNELDIRKLEGVL